MATLGYVILYVPDVGATAQFYASAFGLTPRFVHESGAYAEMETGGTALAFAAEPLIASQGLEFTPIRPDRPSPGVEIALTSPDVPAAVRQALAAGAVLVKPPEEKPWGQVVAYVRDCNGMLVEICAPMG